MSEKRKIAIIGAALFQEPAIIKAKEMGLETHVFAWAAGDPGETLADYFYPISIREKEQILEKCREIGIDGITSIASDLAMETVNYVAEQMNLVGNSMEATMISTNKHLMRRAFEDNGDPSPRSILVDDATDISAIDLEFPLIVKPTDRSGSRGVKTIKEANELKEAINFAIEESFEKKAVIEEFATGDEYSVEYISYNGNHYFIAVTEKTTSGEPWFIEMSHIQPADISEEREKHIREVSEHALDTLRLNNGAAHIELKVDEKEHIKIIEIGGRMGGGFIGSDLVSLSTGYDFVGEVIKVAMGEKIEPPKKIKQKPFGIKFITRKADVAEYKDFKQNHPSRIVREDVDTSIEFKDEPDNISDRKGYYIYEIMQLGKMK